MPSHFSILTLFSRSSFWVWLAFLAFIFLPSQALHYGLFGSTSEEILSTMGWATINLTWVWFVPLLPYPFLAKIPCEKQRNYWQLLLLISLSAFILGSAIFTQYRFGYAIFVLIISLIALFTLNLSPRNVMRGDRFILGILLSLLLFIIIFIAYPPVAVFSTLFSSGAEVLNILQQSYVLKIVKNSLSVALSVGIFSTFLGLLFALYTTRIAKRTVFISKLFSILPLVTPPFVVSLGMMLMLGRAGYITHFLVEHFGISPNWLYGYTGIVLSHTLALTPMAFMLLESALKSLNPSLEEMAYTLQAGRFQAFFTIILPLLKPALANAFLIVVIQSLADFSTPLVLGGSYDVIATQIYFYIAGVQLDYTAASTLGAILLIFSLAIFLIQYLWLGKKSYVTVSGKHYRSQPQGLPNIMQWGIIGILAIWVLFNVLLYGSIFYGSFTQNWGVNNTLTLAHYKTLFGQGLHEGGFPSLIQTLIFAGVSAPITAIIGLLLAYLFVRKQFKGKRLFEFLTLLCFAVPGTVAGLSYVLAFNHSPIYLTGTAVIIVLSMVTRNMPIGVRAAIAALNQQDKSFDEASLTLKANSLKTLWFVVLPLLKPALLSALITSFVRAMTTVSAIIFLVTADTRVATSFILNRVEDGDYGIAVAYGSTLIVLMLSVILLFDKFLTPKRRKEA